MINVESDSRALFVKSGGRGVKEGGGMPKSLFRERQHANCPTGSTDGVSPVGSRQNQGDPHPGAPPFVVMPLSGKSPSLPSEGCDEGQASLVRA